MKDKTSQVDQQDLHFKYKFTNMKGFSKNLQKNQMLSEKQNATLIY